MHFSVQYNTLLCTINCIKIPQCLIRWHFPLDHPHPPPLSPSPPAPPCLLYLGPYKKVYSEYYIIHYSLYSTLHYSVHQPHSGWLNWLVFRSTSWLRHKVLNTLYFILYWTLHCKLPSIPFCIVNQIQSTIQGILKWVLGCKLSCFVQFTQDRELTSL